MKHRINKHSKKVKYISLNWFLATAENQAMSKSQTELSAKHLAQATLITALRVSLSEHVKNITITLA